MVESIRETGDKTEPETRFYITSLVMTAAQLGPVIRSHWTVESMHWVMDMVFRDDECRVRTEHAPANFTTIKHMAHNLIRKAPGKDSSARSAQGRRLGRRVPRKPHQCLLTPSPDCPDWQIGGVRRVHPAVRGAHAQRRADGGPAELPA